MAISNQSADKVSERAARRLVGLGVSRGIGRGKIVFLSPGSRPMAREHLAEHEVEEEVERFHLAVENARQQLRELAEAPAQDADHPVSGIFSVHLLILESSFVEKTEAAIREQRVNAEWAMENVLGDYAARHKALPDDHFRDKYLDIEDVAGRLAKALRGGRTAVTLDPDSVVVARELRPSAVIELAKCHPAGLITETGGWTSHMSILAREFHLPMVTGIKNAHKVFSTGDLVVVDGNAGEVIINPPAPLNTQPFPAFAAVKAEPAAKELMTADNVRIVLRANAESPAAYRLAEGLGAKGVGLYRSELLITDAGTLPGEDRQTAAYRAMAAAVGEWGVAIRTFDISGEQLSGEELPSERNPALGMRAIRAGLSKNGFFKEQIRSILRASDAGRIDIILPMISNTAEILKAKSIIGDVLQELEKEGVSVRSPRLGIMVEVPSTVLLAAKMSRYLDFLCLGTNDLVQYLLAVDRDNDAVADWYQTLHPAVLSAIKQVIVAADDAGIPTTVCGEMAGAPFYVPVLIGLGARELSINTNSIPPVAKLIAGITHTDAALLVASLENSETAEENESRLREYYVNNWKDLFPPGLITTRHR